MRREYHDLEVGTWVDFKRDIEGYGLIIDKLQERTVFFNEKRTRYVVSDGEGDSYSEPSWHSEARYSDKYRRYVVYLESSEVFGD